ncbi:putative B3 domain-containing protein Os06g0632500 [Hordeum vulgare subsp. vulgare]|uniref:TF-B3 domain-containing protein n=1 Tax=Hordeum vulgare subsp. vulgare TaxID=112509 RepID=A0A8I6YHK6_HORVV|nr:putative B3 domain-containing protein Os06g0632500 [Hordeum vulgare subsp. vulgare]
MALSVRRQPRYKFAAPVLSPSCLQKLCVPWEFAARLAAGAGDVQEVHVVDLLGKPRRVELCTRSRPDGGVACWLGAGWQEIVKKNGIGEGWSVVLRRERRGMATLTAYDPACCLACLCTPPAGVMSKTRPRFIKLLRPDDWEKMTIPDEFVQQHLIGAESCPSSQKALIIGPTGKLWPVELDQRQSDVLYGEVWAEFLTAHDLSEGSILLFRYEVNMSFSVQVFLPNGCMKEYPYLADEADGSSPLLPQSDKQLVAPSVSKRSYNKRQVVSGIPATFPAMKAQKVQSQSKPAGVVGRHSFTKQITSYSLKSLFAVKLTFCSSIGLLEACTIQLKTSMGGSARSWPVAFNIANTYGFLTGKGWKRFCQDNEVEEGDRCTFKVVEKMVWHVVIN